MGGRIHSQTLSHTYMCFLQDGRNVHHKASEPSESNGWRPDSYIYLLRCLWILMAHFAYSRPAPSSIKLFENIFYYWLID